MGLPNVNIAFIEAAKTFAVRSERGIVGLILKGGEADRIIEVSISADIPEGIDPDVKEQIELALIGYRTAPRKVLAYIAAEDSENLSAAFEYFETTKISYLAAPGATTTAEKKSVVDFVKGIWQSGEGCIIAVVPGSDADSEVVVNLATDALIAGETVYTAAQYCSRIAGMAATTPTRASLTYAPLPDLTGCTKLPKADMDTAIDAGKLIAFWDGEKVKIARGMNSLKTLSETKGKQFKKIRIVDAMGRVRTDIKRYAEDHYLGKYENSYDNKCVLISAISDYLEILKKEGVLSTYEVTIDLDANRAYLAENGVDTGSGKTLSDFTDDEIKTADTGSHVFLTGKIKFLDTIEDIIFPITV
jgi:hypothetical protein